MGQLFAPTISKIIADLKSGKNIQNKSIILTEIQFEGATAQLTTTSNKELDKIATLLQQTPTLIFEVVGHTDNKGGTKTEKKVLTQRRAKNVVDALILKGIPYQQLQYKGMGWHRPIADNRKEEGRIQNNRIELTVVGILKGPHEIIGTTNKFTAASILLNENEITYWEQLEGSPKTLNLNKIQQINFAYGKQLTFANQLIALNDEPPKKKEPKVNSSFRTKDMSSSKKESTSSMNVSTANKTKKDDKIVEEKNEQETRQNTYASKKAKKPNVSSSNNQFNTKVPDKKEDNTAVADVQKPKKAINTKPNSNNNAKTSSPPIRISQEEEEQLVNYYLDDYPLARPSNDTKATSKNALSSDFMLMQLDNYQPPTTNIDINKIYTVPTSLRNLSGYRFVAQVARRYLSLDSTSIRLRYWDTSSFFDFIDLEEDFPKSDNIIALRLGIMGSMKGISFYLLGDFGGRKNVRYNAGALGVFYALKAGKLSILPGAEFNFGASKLTLGSVDPETPIFQVKKKNFAGIGHSINIAYKNRIVGLSPNLGLAYPITEKTYHLPQWWLCISYRTISSY